MKSTQTNQTEERQEIKEGKKVLQKPLSTKEEGSSYLKTIKRWINRLDYREKLASILLWELISKEHCFDGPDKSIGNDYFAQWEREIIDKAGDPNYLKTELPDEVAVTSMVAMMIPWEA